MNKYYLSIKYDCIMYTLSFLLFYESYSLAEDL